MAFRVGQKVVRVAVDGAIGQAGVRPKSKYSRPVVGEVCTIKTINEWPRYTLITLVEHDNSGLIVEMGCLMEPGFDIRGFRPVVARKTDISIFTAMLTRSPNLADVGP